MGREEGTRERAERPDQAIPALHARHALRYGVPRAWIAQSRQWPGAQYLREGVPEARPQQGHQAEDQSRKEKLSSVIYGNGGFIGRDARESLRCDS